MGAFSPDGVNEGRGALGGVDIDRELCNRWVSVRDPLFCLA